MTKCNTKKIEFPRCQSRRVEAEFSGGDVTSDGGVVVLREIDRRLGLTQAIDQVLPDPRNPDLIEHSQLSMLRQRIYGLCLGYEDLNDQQTLRDDPAWQTAVACRHRELATAWDRTYQLAKVRPTTSRR